MLKNDFKKEYRIIQQHKDGIPFSLWTFNNFEDCYAQLLVLINNTGNYFNKEYYVYNDFFKNEFDCAAKEKFKIEVRDVGEWAAYTEKEKEKTIITDNVIYLQKRG